MSKRDQPVSTAHLEFQRKRGKKECPGCNDIFGKQHFENHRLKYYNNGIWHCSSKTLKSQETSIDDNQETASPYLASSADENDRPLISIIKAKLKSNLQALNNDSDESDSEEEEIWDNVTIADIDSDFNTGDDARQFQTIIDDHDSSRSNMPSLLMSLLIFVCTWQACHIIPDIAIQRLLSFFRDFFNALSAENVAIATISAAFPASVYKLYRDIGFKKDNFTKYVICKKCYKLYDYEDCMHIIEGQQVSKTCQNIRFPNHPQIGRRKVCGELLLKVVQLQKNRKLYPYKTFCYKSLESSVSSLVHLPEFEKNCEKWRSRRQEEGFFANVYDGRIWKEFQGTEKNNFLFSERHYGLMINLDWFQPYEHVQYSVGVMYAVILNLPRNERFKLKNVVLIAIIPDMGKEPSLQTFLDPLIDELKSVWTYGFSSNSFQSKKDKQNFKLALMCVGCDIPATRKLCGFLGHGATLGCSKCMKTFPGDIGRKIYGGFDVENWIPRDLIHQRQLVHLIRQAKTQTEKDSLESKYGLRYSPLWDLEYFDPIRMSIIDPMHNLYQGTAKKLIKIWLELKILLPEELKTVQERVDSVNAASNIGAIPRKISSSFGGFTAEQWKNWTNVFSIFSLKDVLPNADLDIWRKFVLASHTIASKYVTEADIRQYEDSILQFCKDFEAKYGKDRVTPNMHLHYHLSDCIRDYGPVYSFWLFSFERYNGHLGSLPKNNRSVELQMMRRFTRDSFVKSVKLPQKYEITLIKHFQQMDTLGAVADIADEEVRHLLYLAKRSAPILNQDWSHIGAYQYSKASRHCLTYDEHRIISRTYSVMYPDLSEAVIPESCRKCTAVSLGNEVYGSWDSRHKRSSFVMAYWHTKDGEIITETGTGDLTPGIIQTYYLHNLLVRGDNNIHLFARVKWLRALPARYRYHCGRPVEVWSQEMFEPFGPSAFIPVARIYCKFVRADGELSGRKVSFICPLNTGTNI
ncbi:uncharacterized protein [Mytilus edulis]|uniref:uncharacterized protein n=1 Tax=Mytilus edulis TaxID=6550 RepID=UPI0039F06308